VSGTGHLKVAIEPQITSGADGGIAQFVMSLIKGLGRLHDGDETQTIIVRSQEQIDWLKPYLGPNQVFVLKNVGFNRGASTNGHSSLSKLVKRSLHPFLPTARYYMQKILEGPRKVWRAEVRLSDGFYESLGCDVIHIPVQGFIVCALPTIYNPHDLQHLHYPEFFSPEEISWRETVYRAGCRLANTVVVGSQWVKNDVVRQYQIHPEKVQVVPEGAPTQLYTEPSTEFLTQVKRKYQLEEPFAFYPAVTWPHKNHLRLLEAIVCLRESRGIKVQLVCTGSRYEAFWPAIERRIREMNLSSQVKFLGFVPEGDLRALYRLGQFFIEPSLFEASSLPIFEAWSEGLPVACSNAAALPEQVQDAALMFEPYNVEGIAEVIETLARDVEVRRGLRECGYRRLRDFDWSRTAKAYRALYRRAARRTLTEEDHWLLSWNWMTEQKRERESRL
jgi:glycosyltransferase involved in cell wall biosynthesis